MEETIETPHFGPSRKVNLSEPLLIKFSPTSDSTETKKANKKRKINEKSNTNTNKIKPNKYVSEKLPTLDLNKEDPYYELLTKKIILRNDFDRKHVKKLLAEAEEAFEGCDLDDKISDNE